MLLWSENNVATVCKLKISCISEKNLYLTKNVISCKHEKPIKRPIWNSSAHKFGQEEFYYM